MFSPKTLARTAGLLYLAMAVFGGFAFGFALARVYAPGDSATTAANVLANADLVRLGVVADLVQATVMVFLAMTLRRLLKHVSGNAASLIVILVAIAAAIMCLNNVFQVAALLVATSGSYATAFGIQGANALVLLLLDMRHYGFLIAQIFFGLWLAPLGYLVYRSGMFPRALGVVLIVAAGCYLIDVLAQFLAPDFAARLHTFVAVIPPLVAEVWMVLYLLVKGVRMPALGTAAAENAAAAGAEAAV